MLGVVEWGGGGLGHLPSYDSEGLSQVDRAEWSHTGTPTHMCVVMTIAGWLGYKYGTQKLKRTWWFVHHVEKSRQIIPLL